MKLTLTPWKEKSDHRPPLPSLRGGDAELGLAIHSSEMKAEVACGLPPNSTLWSSPVSPSDNDVPVCSAEPVFAEHLLCARSTVAEGP